MFVQRGQSGEHALGRIHGQFDAEAIEALLSALGPLAAPHPSPDGTPDPRTAARRPADALVGLVEIALASGDPKRPRDRRMVRLLNPTSPSGAVARR